jgi:nitrite reductase/ring-hydroxylating ferredoxin subunit
MSETRQRHRVGRASDLPPGRHTVVRAGNRELGIFNIGGTLHALPNLCPHQRGPLCSGGTSGTLDDGAETGWKLAWRHEGEIVTCPWHGLEFHVPSGQCLAWPEIRLRTYDVTVVDGEIEVAL